MHLYLQLTRSLAVTLIWFYCNKLVLRYVRLRVSDLGQVSIPQPGIVTVHNNTPSQHESTIIPQVNNSNVAKIWTSSTFDPLEHREIELYIYTRNYSTETTYS